MPVLLIKLYAYQIIRGLPYMHALGICHRDMKPQNILTDPDTHELKICDFVSAKKLVSGLNILNINFLLLNLNLGIKFLKEKECQKNLWI